MEKEKLEALLIEYIDGNLSATERSMVEKELAENEEAHRLFSQLKEIMQAMDNAENLDSKPGHERIFEKNLKEMSSQPRSGFILFSPIVYRAAAAVVLVMVGVATGYWINQNNRHEEELVALRKEMMETKQLMMTMLANDQSASQRMQGVTVALTISSADDDVVNALVNAMIADPNTNVRLAALEALSKFVEDPEIREILAGSLSKQKDPVVQIALIQLLVRIKEKNVMIDLEKIIEDDKSIQAVKDEAYTGILKLS